MIRGLCRYDTRALTWRGRATAGSLGLTGRARRRCRKISAARLNEGVTMLPWSADLSGRLDEHLITSELLRANPLNDPYERPLWVYTPPGYDDEPERRFP